MSGGHLSSAVQRALWRAAWLALTALVLSSAVQPGLPARAPLAAGGSSWWRVALDACRVPYPFTAGEPVGAPLPAAASPPRVRSPRVLPTRAAAFLAERHEPTPPVAVSQPNSPVDPPIDPAPTPPRVRLRYRIVGLYLLGDAPRVLIEGPCGLTRVLAPGERWQLLKILEVARGAGECVVLQTNDGRRLERCAGQVVELLVDPDDAPPKASTR